jgi:hypothetical protein
MFCFGYHEGSCELIWIDLLRHCCWGLMLVGNGTGFEG